MNTLYQEIAAEQPHLAGWCSPDKALVLGSLVLAHRPVITVEVGVFAGSSFIPMAMAHKACTFGIVIGIDPWDKVAAVQAQVTNEDREWWNNVDMNQIYVGLMETIRRLGLENFTQIVRKKSDEAEVPRGIGILHVDGAHSDQAVRDVVRFGTNVELGGYCVMDDEHWKGGGVTRATQRLLQMGFKRRYGLGTGAVYQRVK